MSTCLPFIYLPFKASVATLAEPWSPLEHETVAPERSVGVLVVIVEVSGDFDVRLKHRRIQHRGTRGTCPPPPPFWRATHTNYIAKRDLGNQL